MDVKIDYTFAVEKPDLSFERNYRPDADLATQVAAVDLSKEIAARSDDFTVCDDTTVVTEPGVIVRTIIVTLTADFVSRFPTEDLQRKSLRNYFRRSLEMRTPYFRTLFEDFTFGDPLCP